MLSNIPVILPGHDSHFHAATVAFLMPRNMPAVINKWVQRLSRVTSGGRFIPEIDGLRFLAISSVILFHVSFSLQRAYKWNLDPLERGMSNILARGTLGVELFFAISGFILALPFARHYMQGAPPVAIKRYYLRRLTRLEPPYILTLILFFTASWLMGDAEMRGHYVSTFLARLFYAHGLIYQDAPVLNGVTWSLEIEVQFYLLVPILVQVFRLPRWLRRTSLAVAIVLLPFLPLQGILIFTVLKQLAFFLAGFLFADLYLDLPPQKTDGTPPADWAALALLLVVILTPIEMVILRQILPTLILIFLILIFRGHWSRRLLSWKPVYLIGGMCYSIYLIHYPFMSIFGRTLARMSPGLGFLPAALIMAFICVPIILAISIIFFALIEHPCMDHTWPQKLMTRFKPSLNKPPPQPVAKL